MGQRPNWLPQGLASSGARHGLTVRACHSVTAWPVWNQHRVTTILFLRRGQIFPHDVCERFCRAPAGCTIVVLFGAAWFVVTQERACEMGQAASVASRR